MRINYLIVFVSDMQRSVAFYRDVMGLPLKFDSPEWTEFETEGVILALHVSDGPNPETDRPQEHRAGQCHPGFGVTDLDEFHERMVAKNVPCIQPPKDAFGARIARYADPDGLAIAVSQQGSAG